MRHTYKLLNIDLHLFDGAAGAAGSAGAEGGTQGDGSALSKAEKPGSSRRGKAGEFSNVVYGKQAAATAEAGTEPSDAGKNKGEGNANTDPVEAKRKAFREMIDGEYKDQFTEVFQKAFNERHKDAKGMEQSLSAQKPIMDMLMQRYNIADGDVAKLQTAIEQDTAYWTEAADKAGLSVEQYMEQQKLKREHAEVMQMLQRQRGEQQAQQQLATWLADSEQVKAVYPTFDFKTEMANPHFRGLLKAGVSMQQSYEVVHMDEIKTAAAKTAAETAGQQMAARIKSKAARPQENGTSSQSAVITKSDVHNLTKKDRAEIARRVQRGEKITF